MLPSPRPALLYLVPHVHVRLLRRAHRWEVRLPVLLADEGAWPVRVRDVGDVSGVVLRLHLDFEGLEWLVNELEPHGWQDEAVKELRRELESIRAEKEMEE